MALAAEIARLRSELQERLHSDPTWQNSGTDQPIPAQPTTAAMPPLYVLPYHQDLQNLPETAMTLSPPNPAPQVRKPHARYPTQADSWPLQILSRHRRSSSSSNSKNEGSEKAWTRLEMLVVPLEGSSWWGKLPSLSFWMHSLVLIDIWLSWDWSQVSCEVGFNLQLDPLSKVDRNSKWID